MKGPNCINFFKIEIKLKLKKTRGLMWNFWTKIGTKRIIKPLKKLYMYRRGLSPNRANRCSKKFVQHRSAPWSRC